MNALTKHFRNLRIDLLKNKGYVARDYAIKSDLPITWVKPPTIACTDLVRGGDQGIDIKLEKHDIPEIYKTCKEFQDADEITKKLLSYKFMPKNMFARAKEDLVGSFVKRHRFDEGSIEYKIARRTAKIYNLHELYTRKQDHQIKNALKEAIEKRQKLLKLLRLMDYRRFEWVLEKLNLIYKPIPLTPLTCYRKDSMRKLTDDYCKKVVQSKLNEYRAELQAQQKAFFREKAEKLAYIRATEIECGVEPTVSEEEIEATKKKAAELA